MFGKARVSRAAMMGTLAALCVGARVAAQDGDDGDFLARRATDRCRRGEYERGLELFRQALDHGRTARALGEMGACELRVARWLDAEAHLRDALALADDPWLHRHHDEVTGWLAEAQSHVARLQIIGGLPGAELRVGDRAMGTLPMSEPLVVTPGLVQVEVRAPGHRPWVRTIEVPGAAITREMVNLERDVVAAPSAVAVATVVCAPGSVLRRGLCYATEDGLAARRGLRGWQVMTLIGGGVALVAGVSALALGAAGAAEESGYLQRCGGVGVGDACVRDRADTQAALDARAGLVNGLAVAAGVGLALGVTSLILDRSAPRTQRVAFGAMGLRVQW